MMSGQKKNQLAIEDQEHAAWGDVIDWVGSICSQAELVVPELVNYIMSCVIDWARISAVSITCSATGSISAYGISQLHKFLCWCYASNSAI